MLGQLYLKSQANLVGWEGESAMTEAKLEELCLEWFRETGWDVLHGPVIVVVG